MTREEAIKMAKAVELIKRRKPYHQDADDIAEMTANIPSAQPQLPGVQTKARWIPCSERLPNICEDILFSVADLYTAEGCLRDDGDWCQFRWDSIIPKDRVTAWMPLPEPHKPEED